jgi:hypothetical protein
MKFFKEAASLYQVLIQVARTLNTRVDNDVNASLIQAHAFLADSGL